jgi:hypothetical protein
MTNHERAILYTTTAIVFMREAGHAHFIALAVVQAVCGFGFAIAGLRFFVLAANGRLEAQS